jgi:hypothetical protein
MRELDSLAWHIMDAMADDWESIRQIELHVTRFHGAADHHAIFKILRKLHGESFLRIMDEDGNGIDDFPDAPETAWFSMTESGRDLWDANGYKYRDE